MLHAHGEIAVAACICWSLVCQVGGFRTDRFLCGTETKWRARQLATTFARLLPLASLHLASFDHVSLLCSRSSVMFYLIDPDGEFVDYYAPNATPSNIAERIGEQIVKFRPMPQK